MRQPNIGAILVALTCVLAGWALPAAAAGWQEPGHWARIGTVQQWLDLDARFYRTYDDNRFADRSQFRLEQQAPYDQTRLYGGDLPAVSIAAFLALEPQEQRRRGELAADKLGYVERFLARMRQQAQHVRENMPSGWGDQVSDVMVLADCLDNLGDAVGLEPTNPYAWHLQSYLALCAGDERRARQYLEGATEALIKVPAPLLLDVRARVALDLAWSQRGFGEFDAALANLDLVERLRRPDLETRTLRGLICAQTGRAAEAGQIAAELRHTEVRSFPRDLKSAGFQPEVLDPDNWVGKPSNYLSAWITALALLGEGNRELALSAFGTFAPEDVYPLGWRFWNEAGLIYEMTGRSGEAVRAWNVARSSRPWIRFMLYKPYDLALGVLTGHDGKSPFMLGYDRFYLSGSRLAFGASLVGKVGAAATDAERQQWAARALEELDICRRTGIYPGQAAVLRGHVYYLLDDIPSALNELETAVGLLEKQGDDVVQAAVMKDLAAITGNRRAADMQAFFKQSGSSRGRWEAEVDPAARERELTARVKESPDDPAAVLALSRFLIRHDRPQAGLDLLAAHRGLQDTVPGVVLRLEADRLLGRTELAVSLVRKLEAGAADPWDDAGLWSLAGSLCLEQDLPREAQLALRHALQLDPENQGLRMQLRLMQE